MLNMTFARSFQVAPKPLSPTNMTMLSVMSIVIHGQCAISCVMHALRPQSDGPSCRSCSPTAARYKLKCGIQAAMSDEMIQIERNDSSPRHCAGAPLPVLRYGCPW
jgi:hypothetical protein